MKTSPTKIAKPQDRVRVGRGIALRLVGTCFLVYVFYTNFGLWSDNAGVRYALTRALVDDASFRIDRFETFLGLDKAVYVDPATGERRLYCDKPPGSSLLMAPQYGAAKVLVRESVFRGATARLRAWLVTCLSVCLYAALSVALLYDVLGRLGVQRGRVGYCYAYAIGTWAFPYATIAVGAQFAAPLVIACMWFALRGDRRRDLIGLGVCVGLTFITYYHAVFIVGWLIALKLLKLRRKARIGWAVVPALAFLALQLGYNAVCFGGPLHISYSYWQGGVNRVALSWPSLRVLHMATFSSWKGVFYYSPWLMFAALGVAYLWQERKAWAAFVALSAACFLGFIMANNQPGGHNWWDANDFGSRGFVPILPVLAIAAAVGIDRLLARAQSASARRVIVVMAGCAVGFGVFANTLGAITSPVQYGLTYENGSYYVKRRPWEPKVKLEDVKNPLLDVTMAGLFAFGSSNLMTQLWPAADVRANPTLAQLALNLATNLVPVLILLLAWRRELGRMLGRRLQNDEAGSE